MCLQLGLLAGWLAGCLAGWLADWYVGMVAHYNRVACAIPTTNRAHITTLNIIVCTVSQVALHLYVERTIRFMPHSSRTYSHSHSYSPSHITKCVNTHYFRDFGKRVRAQQRWFSSCSYDAIATATAIATDTSAATVLFMICNFQANYYSLWSPDTWQYTTKDYTILLFYFSSKCSYFECTTRTQNPEHHSHFGPRLGCST